MPKNSPWFKFDVMEWLGGSIQLLPLDRMGLFMQICALFWENEGPVELNRKTMLRLRVLEGDLKVCLSDLQDFGLIIRNGDFLSVKFLEGQLKSRSEFIENCRAGGKKSARNRSKNPSNKKLETRKEILETREEKEEERQETNAQGADVCPDCCMPDCVCQEDDPLQSPDTTEKPWKPDALTVTALKDAITARYRYQAPDMAGFISVLKEKHTQGISEFDIGVMCGWLNQQDWNHEDSKYVNGFSPIGKFRENFDNLMAKAISAYKPELTDEQKRELRRTYEGGV